jgi:hypothetical protein
LVVVLVHAKWFYADVGTNGYPPMVTCQSAIPSHLSHILPYNTTPSLSRPPFQTLLVFLQIQVEAWKHRASEQAAAAASAERRALSMDRRYKLDAARYRLELAVAG